jgi:hypothetical protein
VGLQEPARGPSYRNQSKALAVPAYRCGYVSRRALRLETGWTTIPCAPRWLPSSPRDPFSHFRMPRHVPYDVYLLAAAVRRVRHSLALAKPPSLASKASPGIASNAPEGASGFPWYALSHQPRVSRTTGIPVTPRVSNSSGFAHASARAHSILVVSKYIYLRDCI